MRSATSTFLSIQEWKAATPGAGDFTADRLPFLGLTKLSATGGVIQGLRSPRKGVRNLYLRAGPRSSICASQWHAVRSKPTAPQGNSLPLRNARLSCRSVQAITS
jgi:hypothetical protein